MDGTSILSESIEREINYFILSPTQIGLIPYNQSYQFTEIKTLTSEVSLKTHYYVKSAVGIKQNTYDTQAEHFSYYSYIPSSLVSANHKVFSKRTESFAV